MQIWVWCMISLSTCRSTFRSTLFCPKGSWLAPASPQSRNNWPKDEIISWWMSRYRITSDEYLASYMNHSPIYLCDCCDRIGVSIHQSSVCHRVHQLILKQTNRLHRTQRSVSQMSSPAMCPVLPPSGPSRSRSWSCSRWLCSVRATAHRHGLRCVPPWVCRSCAHLRWNPCRPLMASQRSCLRTSHTLWGRRIKRRLQMLPDQEFS